MSILDFETKNLPSDLIASAVTALIAIPDAIASAFIAGTNPTYAFNALMTGSPIGALFTGSQFMNIGLTSAMMLAIADAMAGVDDSQYLATLFTLTFLVGLFQVVLGLFKLGKFTRFISNTVLVGFITGVAVLVILGQLGDLTGYYSQSSNKIVQAVDIVIHPGEWNLMTLVVGLGTIGLILVFSRTRLRNYSVALALIVATAVVVLLGLDSVAQVGDAFQISGSIPSPTLPDLSLIRSLALSAVAIGLIGLIQGSAVSQGMPNPDGEYPDASKDFTGQGIANLISGLFQGLPLGGSLGGTGIIKSAGARSRWANVFLGLFVAAFVLIFGNLVELVAMPAVAAVLIVVGIQIINTEEIGDVWDISVSKRVIMAATFIATLTLPVQQAILIGVFLSFIDYVYSSSQNVRLLELEPVEMGTFVEKPAPAKLPDKSVTIIHIRGSTYFAAVRTIQELLPSAKEGQRAVVIIRIRGVDEVGSTMITVLERYAEELRTNGGKLMLSGVSQNVLDQLLRTETTESIPENTVFMATDTLGESTRAALTVAEEWQTHAAAQVETNSSKIVETTSDRDSGEEVI
jgi:SulP family sulfate permease